MIPGWILLLVSLAYVAVLFVVAYWGDARPLYPGRPGLRPWIYSLALAVYCSSWTFYGAVGSAANSTLAYLPIYLGPMLLFVFGSGLIERLTRVAKANNITSIADFIGSRFGKSHALGALVTVIAVTAAIPYIALQYKAVALSISVLGKGQTRTVPPPELLQDSALYTALMLALFAILFGTRRVDATEHHHGMVLAVAVESLVKLIAFLVIGLYAQQLSGTSLTVAELRLEWQLPNGFIAEIRKFYYDLAGASNRGAVASLLELVKPSQVLFGTDFPPGGTSAEYVKALAELKMFSAADLRAIDRDNAVRLLPRLGQS